MPKIPTDATLDQIKELHAEWVAGALSSEDALFQISDVLQSHDAADGAEATPVQIAAG